MSLYSALIWKACYGTSVWTFYHLRKLLLITFMTAEVIIVSFESSNDAEYLESMLKVRLLWYNYFLNDGCEN